MEYDKYKAPTGVAPSSTEHEQNDIRHGRGHLRVASQVADVSVLAEPVTFAFSGRTAKNRFLKAPMTERLCRWNKDGENIVCSLLPASFLRLKENSLRGECQLPST